MFHEMTLKLYFMKCPERKISQSILPLGTPFLTETLWLLLLYLKIIARKIPENSSETDFEIFAIYKIPEEKPSALIENLNAKSQSSTVDLAHCLHFKKGARVKC